MAAVLCLLVVTVPAAEGSTAVQGRGEHHHRGRYTDQVEAINAYGASRLSDVAIATAGQRQSGATGTVRTSPVRRCTSRL